MCSLKFAFVMWIIIYLLTYLLISRGGCEQESTVAGGALYIVELGHGPPVKTESTTLDIITAV